MGTRRFASMWAGVYKSRENNRFATDCMQELEVMSYGVDSPMHFHYQLISIKQ